MGAVKFEPNDLLQAEGLVMRNNLWVIGENPIDRRALARTRRSNEREPLRSSSDIMTPCAKIAGEDALMAILQTPDIILNSAVTSADLAGFL